MPTTARPDGKRDSHERPEGQTLIETKNSLLQESHAQAVGLLIQRLAECTTLKDYPLTIRTGGDHVAALSDALAALGRTARIGIEEMDELNDADSGDILAEVSRGIDKWLWFVEGHLHAGTSPHH